MFRDVLMFMCYLLAFRYSLAPKFEGCKTVSNMQEDVGPDNINETTHPVSSYYI
jgi:hypothetical protein